jgi:hypothetical protein
MELQLVLENGEPKGNYHEDRTVRVLIFDNLGRLQHSTDFCLACLMSKVIGKKREILYREQFSTGKETICEGHS